MDYSQKLKDPRWQKKRLEILDQDKFTCQICLSTIKTLHVHHRVYLPGKDPWDYPEDTLITLCEGCHQYETENVELSVKALGEAIKIHFFSYEIDQIAKAFKEYKHAHQSDVCATAISFFLSDQVRLRFMVDEYFDFLLKNRPDAD